MTRCPTRGILCMVDISLECPCGAVRDRLNGSIVVVRAKITSYINTQITDLRENILYSTGRWTCYDFVAIKPAAEMSNRSIQIGLYHTFVIPPSIDTSTYDKTIWTDRMPHGIQDYDQSCRQLGHVVCVFPVSFRLAIYFGKRYGIFTASATTYNPFTSTNPHYPVAVLKSDCGLKCSGDITTLIVLWQDSA